MSKILLQTRYVAYVYSKKGLTRIVASAIFSVLGKYGKMRHNDLYAKVEDICLSKTLPFWESKSKHAKTEEEKSKINYKRNYAYINSQFGNVLKECEGKLIKKEQGFYFLPERDEFTINIYSNIMSGKPLKYKMVICADAKVKDENGEKKLKDVLEGMLDGVKFKEIDEKGEWLLVEGGVLKEKYRQQNN